MAHYSTDRTSRTFLLVTIVLLLVAPTLCFGAEIDSVTPRGVKLENSLSTINRIINERIEEGLLEANKDSNGKCDEDELYDELRKAIFQSFTASWGLKGYGLDKQFRELLAEKSYTLSLNDSIYRDINYLEGFSLNLKELSDVVNINGHLIGIDKLGHFFAEGWSYFDRTHNDGNSFREALEWGKKQEEGKFGYATTGVFSYSDLAANFNGWRFWNKVQMQQKDPLKGFLANLFAGSYAQCKIQIIDSIKKRKIVRAWEQTDKFDLGDYLDGSWDEGNNCNSYEDPIIEAKVLTRIKQCKPDFNCPALPSVCSEAQDRYGSYAKYLLHPQCLTVKQ